MDTCDTDAIRAQMNSSQDASKECVTWCEKALADFRTAAIEVATPVAALDMASIAARASGIAKAPWPTEVIGAATVARYYRILTNSDFNQAWPAADGQGLTQSVSGPLFLAGKPVSTADAAAYIARVTSFDPVQAKELFDAALLGKPFSVGRAPNSGA